MSDSSPTNIPPRGRPPAAWFGYAVAVVAVAVATLARFALDPVLGNTFPFTTFFVAAALVAGFGRTRPAAFTLVGGGLLAVYLFVPPRSTFPITDTSVLLALVVYLVAGGVIVGMSHVMRVARRRAEGLLAEVSAREQVVAEQRERLRTTLASIGDGVITTDSAGRVTNLNPVAESLTGWTTAEAAGQPLEVVFKIVNEATRLSVDNPAMRALKEGVVVGLANHTILIARDGTERPIDDSAAPIRGSGGAVLVFRDITERHMAEQKLRESEERAAFVRRASGVGFWYCDLPFDVLEWDESVKTHFHLPADAPVTIDTFYARIHSDDREPTRRAIERSIRDRTGYDTEYRTVSPDTGSVRWVRAIGRTFYAADGTPTRFDGVTLDVSDQKRAGEQQAFLIRLADTLRPLSDPIDVQAEASRVLGEHLGANRVVYFEIRGEEYVIERDYTAGVRPLAGRYPVAAFGPALLAALLNGRTVIEVDATTERDRSPDERASFAAIQVRGHVDVPLVKGGRFVAGMTVHVSDRRDWIRQEVALIEDTAERTWAAVERVRAETEVARLAATADRERRLFATVLSSTPDFIYTFDLEGRFVYINAALLTLWGKRLDEAVGQNFFGLNYPPALADRLQRQIQQVIDTKQTVRDDTPYTSGLGERMYEYIFVPVVGADGTVEAVAGSTRDITDRKRAEEELRRLAADLSDADRRKDEFLATLAHELRNPLAPLRNGLQVLRMTDRKEAREQARTMMERQLEQMVRLVDDLLDVSRISRGKIELRKERVPLEAVLNSAVETSRPLIDQMGHRLTVTLPDHMIVLDADLTRLSQVFLNLLNNAAKYSDRGGTISLKAERQGSDIVVSVTDTGIGIDADQLPRLFDMFSQVDRSLEKAQGGLGIGLSLVKGLVEMHGGTVEAKSGGAGQGSEFMVRLPVVGEASVPPKHRLKDEQPAPKTALRILIVDDNRDGADSLAEMMKLMGNDTRTAYDGEEAVAAAVEFRPDVILLDIGLPKMNGYEACRRIREQSGGRPLLIIAQTGWGADGDRQRTTAAGFDHHMVKPVDPAALEKLLAGMTATG